MKRWITSLLAVLVLALLAAVPSHAEAQELGDEAELEVEGTTSLEEGAPVRRLLLLRSGRFELQPQTSFSLIDPFVRNIAFGAGAAYYFTNSLGVGTNFVYSPVHIDTDEVEAVASDGFSQRVKEQLSVSQMTMAFDLGIIYVPLFGKFSVFGWILNYDLHLFGGAGGLIMEARCADESPEAGIASCEVNENLEGIKFAGALGIGTRVYFNNWLALNLEFRDYLGSFAEYARSESGDPSKFGQMFLGTVGLSFFFPLDVYISR